jgi:hypothetical protein
MARLVPAVPVSRVANTISPADQHIHSAPLLGTDRVLDLEPATIEPASGIIENLNADQIDGDNRQCRIKSQRVPIFGGISD